MEILQNILHLNESDKNKLKRNKITSANAFINSNDDDLQRVLDVSLSQVVEMRSKLNKVFKLEVKLGSDLLQKALTSGETFETKIGSIDEILTIMSDEIIEITGPPAVGKSMLLNTIMISVLDEHEDAIIYLIDTKYDFSSVKLKRMMENQGISEMKQLQILKRIRLERALTATELTKILLHILNTPLQHVNLKMIMIDSITVPFYLHLDHTVTRLNHMTQITGLMKSLGRQNISVSFILIFVLSPKW